MDNYCLTYFLVFADAKTFDFADFCNRLELDFAEMQRWTAINDGVQSVEIGRNEVYDDDVNVMIRRTLKDLFGKEEILASLKTKYNLEFWLERVPIILVGENKPRQKLSLDADVITFMHKTGTRDDLDYHLG